MMINDLNGRPPTIGDQRRSHLTSLAAELRKLGAPVLIALSETDHPVLYTVRGGRRVAVVAVEVGKNWWFLWGRNDLVAAERADIAAAALAERPAAKVTRLFDRRPKPRAPMIPAPLPRMAAPAPVPATEFAAVA